MSAREKWAAFLAGVRRSKTMWLSMLLAALGVLEAQRAALEPLLKEHAGLVFVGLGVVIAVLRVRTTQSLIEKGKQ